LADSETDSVAEAGVFISYASQDATIANALVDALEREGLQCWVAPRDVTPGAQYADEIVRAINESDVLVLILSERSAASAHVGREIERASSKGRRIVSVRTDATPLPRALEYFLSESQWIDLESGGTEAAADKLVRAIRRHRDPGARSNTPIPAPPRTSPLAAVAPRRRPLLLAAIALCLLALAFLGGRAWLAQQNARTTTNAATSVVSEKSIAVLPFTDLSEKKDQEYFADGMAEEVRDLLARIPGLKVIGGTSSFQFKGANQDLRAIGSKLGAAYVVEGSVRRSQERVRVSAQLIDARDGAQRWSETYDRPSGDATQVQDEIAAALARALQVSVGADQQLARRRPKSDEAYDLYLRGRSAAQRDDAEGIDTAINYLQQALEIDPEYPDAAEALAHMYYWQACAAMVPSQVGYEQARRAAESALKRDPALGLAHAVLGGVHSDYDRDWKGADTEFKKALALAPHDGRVLMLTAQLPVALGELDVARRIYKHALDYDPLSTDNYWFLSWVELRAGNWAAAEAAARKTVEIAPDYVWGHAAIAFPLLMRGEREQALAEAKRETDPMIRLQALAIVYHALGRKAESDAALKELIAKGADREAFQIASVYAYRGERDPAFQWLDRAHDQRDPNLFLLLKNPFLSDLEHDPRYKAFLKKVNLPE
jgi:TolB-like protein